MKISYKLPLLFFLLLWSLPQLLFGQEKERIDSLKRLGQEESVLGALSYSQWAKKEFKSKNYSEALQLFEEEIRCRSHLADTGELPTLKVRAYYNASLMARVIGQYELAKKHGFACLNSSKKLLGEKDVETLDAYRLLADIGYYSQAYELEQNYGDTALWLCESATPLDSSRYTSLLVLQAAREIKKGFYLEGEQLLKKALAIEQQRPKDNLKVQKSLAKIYNDLAVVSDYQDRFGAALSFYNKALALRKSTGGEEQLSLIWLYDNMGVLYHRMDRPLDALEYQHQALDIAKKLIGEDHPRYALVLQHSAVSFEKLKQYGQAEKRLKKAIQIYTQSLAADHPKVSTAKMRLAKFKSKQDWPAAQALFQEAENILLQNPERNAPALADLYFEWADAADKHKLGPVILEKTILALAKNRFQTKDGYREPRLALRCWTLWLKYASSADFGPKKQALFALQSDIHRQLERSANQSDKQLLLSTAKHFYGAYIDHIYRYKEQYLQKEEMRNQLLALFETSKSVLLKHSLALHQKLASLKLTAEQEKACLQAQKQAIYYEELWTQADPQDKKEFSRLEKQYEQAKAKWLALKAEVGLDKAKQKTSSWQLPLAKELQGKLAQKELLLHYFSNQDGHFRLSISQNSFELEQINELLLEGPIIRLINSFYNSEALFELDASERYNNFIKDAELLSQLLLPKNLEQFEQLSIVSDGILEYLPFELLLSKKAGPKDNFQTLPYLVKTKSIRYVYNWEVLQKQEQHIPQKDPKMLALAPIYNWESPMHKPLAGAQEEVAWLHKRYPSKNIAPFPNKQELLANIGSYQLVHLAMHALAPDSSDAFLLLPEEGPKGRLDSKELAALSLENQDLLVLSACQTALGQQSSGEGVMSLGRALAHSAAPSAMVTLWSWNDESAVYLMRRFYIHLEQGSPKDKALQAAKLDYINNAKEMHCHPFFWAAAILYGNRQALALRPKPNYSPYYWGGAGLAALLILALALWRRKS
ncbi:TPR repeat-containing protein [Saprospira grandis str. Lewin]|uniref:TPR repeat-containing protein n=2 Tax=Saprospira TaxID=1007 RepID=H6L1X6_SAPGL|nr:TPR repeat-containing protein [Saprospira grandis str. Lewin]